METFAMNNSVLGEYCRKKGLYREQIEEKRLHVFKRMARHLIE